jgi:hypothetical protein
MKQFLISCFLLTALPLLAQKQNFKSKSELGILAGGSYYIGDLNPYEHFKNTKLALGLIYKYNINTRIALRANFNHGNVGASDASSSNALLKNRNLNFSSEIFEFGTGIEFSYLPFQIGNPRYYGSAYLVAEIGIFHMNPTTKFNDDVIELQTIGTEGQGTSLTGASPYPKTQLCIPLAVGCKFAIGRKLTLSMEYGIRKTFTDYLDDVHSSRYIDSDQLGAINGPLAATLSNRSLDGSRFGTRGNPSTKDLSLIHI